MIDVKNRVYSIMAVIFDINVDEIPDNAAPGVIDKWDSLKHMSLILALEEEFELRFTDKDMSELLNFELIVSIISEKINND